MCVFCNNFSLEPFFSLGNDRKQSVDATDDMKFTFWRLHAFQFDIHKFMLKTKPMKFQGRQFFSSLAFSLCLSSSDLQPIFEAFRCNWIQFMMLQSHAQCVRQYLDLKWETRIQYTTCNNKYAAPHIYVKSNYSKNNSSSSSKSSSYNDDDENEKNLSLYTHCSANIIYGVQMIVISGEWLCVVNQSMINK